MRLIFTLLFFITVKTFAQSISDDCKNINDIAMMERLSHERLALNERLTFASNNFDIKYYRLEWEVDPAIRYITGKVTAYYVITSSTNTIAFDLMSSGLNVFGSERRQKRNSPPDCARALHASRATKISRTKLARRFLMLPTPLWSGPDESG